MQKKENLNQKVLCSLPDSLFISPHCILSELFDSFLWSSGWIPLLYYNLIFMQH